MLCNVVKQIFEHNGYKIVSDLDFDIPGYTACLALPEKEGKKQEYFLLLEHKAINDEVLSKLLAEDSAIMFETLERSAVTDEAFSKNCSMILCCDFTDEKKISGEMVLALEEDAYHFKKNLILYTQSELKDWLTRIKVPPTMISINEIINEDFGASFRSYKNDGGQSSGYYSLLIKIAIKIPIIKYLPPVKSLIDLKSNIRSQLCESDSKILNFILNIDLQQPEETVEQILFSDWSTHG